MLLTSDNLPSLIDHTLLVPTASADDIALLAKEAHQYGFFSVCIHPAYISLASELLCDSKVKICTVIDFPLGQGGLSFKKFQTEMAIKTGADEIDMVMNIAAFKDHRFNVVLDEIKTVVSASSGAVVKVIIETCLLSDNEKVSAANICIDGEAHFVKTSTGFSRGGAEIEDISLLSKAIGPQAKIKASGGIKSLASAQAMISAGAHRIGTSSGTQLVGALLNKK